MCNVYKNDISCYVESFFVKGTTIRHLKVIHILRSDMIFTVVLWLLFITVANYAFYLYRQ